jgi:hypothetical protein
MLGLAGGGLTLGALSKFGRGYPLGKIFIFLGAGGGLTPGALIKLG